MPERTAGVTSRELIEAAAGKGYSVSESQLERWRRKGLLPKPMARPGRGRGRGRVGVYPSYSTAQLLALLRIQKEDRRASYWGWRLWGEGFDVLRFVRPRLIGYFRRMDDDLRETLERFDAGNPDNAIAQSPRMHLGRVGDSYRRRVGPEMTPTVARVFLEVFSGQFSGDWVELDVVEILDKLWSTPKLKEVTSDMTEAERIEGLVEVLREASQAFNVPELRQAAESASDDDLIQVRDEIGAFFALIGRPGRVTFGAFMLWFVVRKGSNSLARFANTFLTDPSFAESREKFLQTLGRQ